MLELPSCLTPGLGLALRMVDGMILVLVGLAWRTVQTISSISCHCIYISGDCLGRAREKVSNNFTVVFGFLGLVLSGKRSVSHSYIFRESHTEKEGIWLTIIWPNRSMIKQCYENRIASATAIPWELSVLSMLFVVFPLGISAKEALVYMYPGPSHDSFP